jgi:hypothetical protein
MYCPFCGITDPMTVEYAESEYDYFMNCPRDGRIYIAHLKDRKLNSSAALGEKNSKKDINKLK